MEEMSGSTGQLRSGRVGLEKFTGHLFLLPRQAKNFSQHPNSKLGTHSEGEKQQPYYAIRRKQERKKLQQFLAGAKMFFE